MTHSNNMYKDEYRCLHCLILQYVTVNSLRPSEAYIISVNDLTIIGSDNGLSPGLGATNAILG